MAPKGSASRCTFRTASASGSGPRKAAIQIGVTVQPEQVDVHPRTATSSGQGVLEVVHGAALRPQPKRT
jgi:hypothetical protein